ncbi:type I polyketide synthase [Streptomyces chartreusis]|uniref:type I polyketide synthase n=1 Tax=Streptomyces chartreusis TaxID=1969 RepID=UPI00386683A1
MSAPYEKVVQALRKSLEETETLKKRNRQLVAASREPIAIVGMACRFPGDVSSPEELWEMLAAGRDGMVPFPQDRGWDIDDLYDPVPGQPGRTYANSGGFVPGVADFDAGLFGISPREALAMDPQQRLLLEVSWEALERAGVDPVSVRGSVSGVFVGTNGQDYLLASRGGFGGVEGFVGTGSAASVMSGRVAYALGLEGPAVTVDTACSSALVAVHLAVGALRSGECGLALAGGVTVMSTPAAFVEFSRQRGLAVDGRCKAFGEGADGTVWGEGGGVLVLERLSDARRNNHPVLAVVRGSAVNQDGASNGLTAPNGPSQQRVIRQALKTAGISAADVDVVEAHGTGTTLGDPIEAQALLSTYGQERTDGPLWLGSVKSNLGHTQAAAGVAGVIKMVLAMQRESLPATLHVDRPSSHVDWEAGRVRLLTESRAWPRGERTRRAGVSAFGISGTNAHVILEEAPAEKNSSTESDADLAPSAQLPITPWLFAGRDADSLRAQAERLATHLTAHPVAPTDIGHSLATTRAVLTHRAVVLGPALDELSEGVRALADGDRHPAVVTGHTLKGRTAWVFTGQGSQRPGMGRELHAAFPEFRRALDEVCDLLDAELRADDPDHVSLRETMFTGDPETLSRTGHAQPALFALQVALVALLRSWGMRPDSVLGHSVGEFAAAYAAGVFELPDAVRLVAARARLMQALPEGGAMAAIEAGEDEVAEVLKRDEGAGDVAIAAVNGPRSVVVSGTEGAVEGVVADFHDRGCRTKRLRVSHAFHSPLMDPMLAEFTTVAAGVTYRTPTLPAVSTLTGEVLRDGDWTTPTYWIEQVRRPVRFHDALTAVTGPQGAVRLLEIGPDAVLTALAREDGHDAAATLRAGQPEPQAVLTAVAEMYVRGADVRWHALFEGTGARRVDLPTYAFSRERYWLPDHVVAERGTGTGPDGVEARFWDLVERGDVDVLAERLGVSGDQALDTLVPALSAWRRQGRLDLEQATRRYRVRWRPVRPAADPGALPGRWLVATPDPDDQAAADITAALRLAGAEVDLITVTAADTRADLTRRIRDIGQEPTHALALVPTPGAVLALWQALFDSAPSARLWCATRSAQSVGAGDVPSRPDEAAVWGLGRTLALEQPDRWGGLVDLPAHPDADDARRLAHLLAEPGDEDQLALRPTGVLAARLVRDTGANGQSTATSGGQSRSARFHGTALVTGGTGALGRHIAHWLVDQGAEHVVLVSRRGADAPGVQDLRDELRDRGADVTLAACDVADRAALAGLLDAHPPTVVVHAAGILDDGLAADLTPERLARVLAAKADAARHLHELTAGRALDAFVLFSSTAGVTGNAGQSAYAAANARLDALAQHRRAAGLPATSVAWGPWAGDGMAADPVVTTHLARLGIRPLTPDTALDALGRILDDDRTCVTVLDADWARFAETTAYARQGSLLRELTAPAQQDARTAHDPERPAAGTGELATALHGRPPAERERLVLAHVRSTVAEVLGHGSAAAIAADRPFNDLGFDSLTSVELRNRLGAATGLRLPATLVYDHPTPAALASHIRAQLPNADSDIEAGDTTTPGTATGDALDDDAVAIVGMACRFPGDVSSPEELWEMLAAGRDGVVPFPADRGWDIERVYHPDPENSGTSYVNSGGFVSGVADFDAGLFGISPREALAMDPQQRLLLEVSWEALERAGVDPVSVRGSVSGVFVGTNGQDYLLASRGGFGGVEGFVGTGSAASVMSGRVAYALGLEGPAVTVDTACSSALVAVHLAVGALRSGECGLALAGGVTVMSTPAAFVEFSRQRGLAVDGRCKAFGEGADGTVWGEGGGVLVLERLSDARRNNHPVLAVVRGSAVNQDGASNGLTAPNGPSQQRVIRQALKTAGISAADVDVVEAHGTGTTLGDPIEAQALLSTYGQERTDGPLWLGSVKSNLGHTQAAAGVAGVIKMVLAMQRESLPATLHVDRPSSHVDWEAGRVRLLTESRAWPRGERTRRAGVSAFGISGTNAHVILEEAPEPEKPARPAPEASLPLVPWVLSAHRPESLTQQAARLATSLTDDHAAHDIGHCLATTRAALAHRAVALGPDTPTLAAALTSFGAGATPPDIISGTVTEGGTAWLFTGQGSQRPGMGRELYARFPVFARTFDEVCAHLDGEFDGAAGFTAGVRAAVFAPEGSAEAALLDRTGYAQAALFAVQVSLVELLRSWGTEPDCVVGHSVGEFAAAYAAGVFELPDAVRLVAARARLMQALPEGGAMAAIEAAEDEVAGVLERHEGTGDVVIAAVNGPRSVVVSGAESTVEAVLAEFRERGCRTSRLRVSHAFHSPLMKPVLDDFAAVADGITYRTPAVPAVSTVTGQTLGDGDWTTAGYWADQIVEPVRFHDALTTVIADQGAGRLLEIGPDPVLSSQVPAGTAVAVSVLRRDRAEVAALLTALAEVFVHGADVDWGAVFAGTGARRVDLPTYAFQRRRYWLPDRAGEDGAMSFLGIPEAPRELPASGEPLPTAYEQPSPVVPANRLRSLAPAERESAVLDLVVAQVAQILGHSDTGEVGATQRFLELGFTSLSLADLRNRVARACGVELPTSALYEHATPRALAAHVGGQLGDRKRQSAVSADSVTGLVRYAFEREQYDKGLDMLHLAAAMRPAFGLPDTPDGTTPGRPRDTPSGGAAHPDARPGANAPAPRPVRLATGSEGEALLCLPSLVAPVTAYQYSRFAAALHGSRDVWVLPAPGYAAGEALPDSPEAAAARQAEAVLAAFGDKPLTLVGYSSGGWQAHLLAAVLTEAGAPPRALVLLDSPETPDENLALAMVATSCRLMRDHPDVPVVADQLTATAHYGRLFDGWRPAPAVEAPRTLFVSAAEHDPALLLGADRPEWPLPHEAVEVPGTHISLLDGDADTTAHAVHAWLLER